MAYDTPYFASISCFRFSSSSLVSVLTEDDRDCCDGDDDEDDRGADANFVALC